MSTISWLGGTDGLPTKAENWAGGVVPQTGDGVIVPASATVDIEGVDQHDVDFQSLDVEDGCKINIGTATSPWIIGRTTDADFAWGGTGETHLRIAGDASGGTFYGRGTGTLYLSSYSTEETIDKLYITSTVGTYYLAAGASEIAKIDTITIAGSATVKIGEGVTATAGGSNWVDLNTSAGTIATRSNIATLTARGGTVTVDAKSPQTARIYAGTVTINGTSGPTITLIAVYSGLLKYNCSQTLTTLEIYTGGTADFSANPNTCGVTNIDVFGAGVLRDPRNVIAAGAVVDLHGTSASEASVDFGTDVRLTTGAIS